MVELLTVRDLRNNLREVIDRASQKDAVFEVGAHRKAEVVLLSVDRYRRETIPDRVLGYLVMAATAYAIETYQRPEGGVKGRDPVWNPGDPFGAVVGWLWASGRKSRCALMVADVIAQARADAKEAGVPRPAFSNFLKMIPFGLFSEDVPEHEEPELIAYLRAEVPKYVSDPDLESP